MCVRFNSVTCEKHGCKDLTHKIPSLLSPGPRTAADLITASFVVFSLHLSSSCFLHLEFLPIHDWKSFPWTYSDLLLLRSPTFLQPACVHSTVQLLALQPCRWDSHRRPSEDAWEPLFPRKGVFSKHVNISTNPNKMCLLAHSSHFCSPGQVHILVFKINT